MTTQINLLPLVTLAVSASQDGDFVVPIAFQNAGGGPIDLTGIGFGLILRTSASTPTISLNTAGTAFILNGGIGGNLTIAVPLSSWGRIPAGTYVGDLVATADGATVVIGSLTVTQTAIGGCLITSVTTESRNAATAGSVGYIPGPGWNQYRGDYSNVATYLVNDVVYYTFSSWICTALTTGNAPTIGSPCWHLVAPGVDPAVVAGATALIGQVAALQTAAATYAPSASPALTGTPTAPTASPGTASNQIATTNYVATAVAALVGAAPAALDTIYELAAQLTSDESAAANLATLVGTKAKAGANIDITSLGGLTTALSIAQGGTGAATASAALIALGAVGRTAVADAPYTANAADRTIAFTSLTAARIVTLPAASAYPTGTPLLVVDESGACSATLTVALARAGSDTINGASSAIIALPYGFLSLVSNGAGKWTVVDQSTASMGQQSASSVAITGGSINGTTVGASTPASGAFTTMSTTGAASFGGAVSMSANSLSLSYLAQLPPGMLLGNATGATANVTPATVSAYLDYAYGNPAPRGTVIVKGASGFVARTPSATGQGLFFDGTDTNFSAPATVTSPPQPAQGRLTLTSGVPVLTANVSAATSIFYTPYTGALVPLWNGSIFVPTSFAEVSQALSDTTKSPSAAAAAQVYDLFAWSDGGTFRVSRGPAWSAGATAGSATARGSGAGSTALSRNAGVLVNQVAITNGPAAGYGTFVGTIATDPGGATVSFNTGSVASGGGAASIGLWNMYNRVSVAGSVRDNTNSWNYATAAWRAANNSASARVTFVTGVAEDTWSARYATIYNTSNAAAAGVALDSTNTYSGTTTYNVAAAGSQAQTSEASAVVAGQHYFSAVEYAASGTMVAYGNSGVSAYLQTGLNWSGRY